jgi:site-specific DNA recombinase
MIQRESKLAVIYCRVSSTKQLTQHDGLKSQETRCREFARMKDYEVLEVFADDVSGSLINRPAMKEMLSFIRKRRFAGVVVIIDDVSRLARGLQAHLELRSLIASAGGVLESPSIEFGDDPDSVLVENLLASVSQHQRQKNGEQTKNRMRARIMNGYWVFQAPVGYCYERVPGRGMMLKRDEPAASVVQEAIEGYASARFALQADVMRFLQDHPLFPRGRGGFVRNMRVTQLLNQCVYAGFVAAPKWGVSVRPGHHEALVTIETFQRVQDRLNGMNHGPSRTNVNADFPLRGFVVCDDCGAPLTASWSKGQFNRYGYYSCFKRECASFRKSIRHEKVDGDFEGLLRSLQPTEGLFKVARAMFESLWNHRLLQADAQRKAVLGRIQTVEREINQFLSRIVETNVSSVVAAYEGQISKLAIEKAALKARMEEIGQPKKGFDEALRTALGFLSNPQKLWASDRLEDRRAVLRLAFSDRLRYSRNEGFRTANLSLPFKVLGRVCRAESEMARPKRFELLTF